MIEPAIFLRRPLQFQEICTVYPPSVNEVVDHPKSMQWFKLLTQSAEDIEDLYENNPDLKDATQPTPLEFILINCYKSSEFKQIISDAFEFFIHEPVTFLFEQKMIIIGAAQDLARISDFKQVRYLSETTFTDFQNRIRIAMGKEEVLPAPPDESPLVHRIKVAARRRARLAEKSKEKDGKGLSLTTILGAICCMGIGLTPLNIGEISYASIDVLMKLYQQKEKYQTDIDSLMAGANPKKVHPKYWIREKSEIHEVKV